MKKRLFQCFIGFFALCAAGLAAFAGSLRLRLKNAQKKTDTTHPQKFYESPEGTVAFRSVGHGKPLLLLHSMMLGASHREWDGVIDALAEQYHVYALDLPGFGNSFSPETPWTAYQYANFLHTFISDEIGRAVCICGANGGADLALVLSLLHPEDLRRLILLSPEGIGKGFATAADTKPLSLLLSPLIGTQLFLSGTSKAKIRTMLEASFYAKERISPEMVRQYQDAARCGSHAQVTFAMLRTRLYAADTKNAFAQLSLPFLMIWGEKNEQNPAAYLETAEKMKTHGSFLLFEDVSALPHLENSGAFIENVKEFLK